MSAVHDHRIAAVEQKLTGVDKKLDRLIEIHVRQAEDRKRIDDHEERLRELEAEAATTKLIKRWVIGGVLGGWLILASLWFKPGAELAKMVAG